MKRAKFKYYGHLSLGGQIALFIGCFLGLMVFGITYGKSPAMHEKTNLLLIVFFIGSILYWTANNILTHLKQVEFKDGALVISKLMTNKVQKINLTHLSGYKINGLTLQTELINLEGETIATLYNPFYKDLNAFLLENDIQQININESYFRWLAV